MKTSGLLVALGLLAAAIASAQVPSTLANFSTRGQIGPSGGLIAGFVIDGSVAKTLLVRGVGPGLAGYGVSNPASGVNVTVYDASGNVITSNSGYQNDPNATSIAATAASVGAFPLSNAGDSETVASLQPGAYTVQVTASDATSAGGDVLLELYDADAPGTDSRLVNLSTRGQIGASDNTLITGFVVSGTDAKNLLIRGVGPDLTQFGVTNAAGNVAFTIYDSNGNAVASAGGGNTDPTTGAMAATALDVGAFPLSSATGDAATIVTLAPGAYTIAVTPPTDGSSGQVGLVEVYDADGVTAQN